MLKSQDCVVLIKLLANIGIDLSQRQLSAALGISLAEVNAGIKRLEEAGLLRKDKQGKLFPNVHAANFQNADLSKVNFKAANLSSADFTNASLKGANLDFSILIGAKLTQEQLKSAKSYYCAVLPDGTLAPPEYQSHNCIDRW